VFVPGPFRYFEMEQCLSPASGRILSQLGGHWSQ
jgi:hypothetical protein